MISRSVESESLVLENNARLQETLGELDHAFTPGYRSKDNTLTVGSFTQTRPTISPLAAAAPADNWFVGVDNHGRTFYSRNGDFQFKNGQLTTPNGYTVLGFPTVNGKAGGKTTGPNDKLPDDTQNGDLEALTADPVDVALGRVTNPHVEADGTVAYTRRIVDAKSKKGTDERVVMGKIALARFPAGTQLSSSDGVHMTPSNGVIASVGSPGKAGFSELMTHRVDRGSMDFAAGLAALRDAAERQKALQVATESGWHTSKITMDLLK